MRTIVDEKEVRPICLNCRFRERESIDGGFICINPDSEYIGEWIMADDFCEEFKEKE